MDIICDMVFYILFIHSSVDGHYPLRGYCEHVALNVGVPFYVGEVFMAFQFE
jgi:hypothetical protein